MRTVPMMGNGGLNNGSENGHASAEERVTLTGYEVLREGGSGEEVTAETGSRERLERLESGGGGRETSSGGGKQEQTTPNVKKRHRYI